MKTKQLIEDLEKLVKSGDLYPQIQLNKENREKYDYDVFEVMENDETPFIIIPPKSEKALGHGYGYKIPNSWIALKKSYLKRD